MSAVPEADICNAAIKHLSSNFVVWATGRSAIFRLGACGSPSDAMHQW
jgi:hypothetical protein